MAAFTVELDGTTLVGGASVTFTFTQKMGKIAVKNSGPGTIAIAIGGVAPGAVARGPGVNLLDPSQATAIFPISEDQISILADGAGAGVDVQAHPQAGFGLGYS